MKWKPHWTRAFISHTNAAAANAARLAEALASFSIHGFVAHDAIDSGAPWRGELEDALNSAHALIALVTRDWSASHWTDQEAGWACGRGIPVIPISMGATPYGFIGDYQALPWSDDMDSLAEAFMWSYIRMDQPAGVSALVNAAIESPSFATSRRILQMLLDVPYADEEIYEAFTQGARSNDQLYDLEPQGLVDRVAEHLEHLAGQG